MPEEKKENKAAAKDSFTFSDKIKNSKPAASKSFANRISSKIGSDGKPRRTLFERTKRDAPFFIAAIVALLLLPFLYKYSGSVDEDPSMVTPAIEDTAFDPNRSGFDGIGDPEGQIAQLSGRDSMDLIVGFGNKKDDSDDSSFNSTFDRSGFDSDDYSSTNNNTKEYNEKNIYRYKKQAAPATKASFQKTNINPLRGAGLTSRGGGKLGVGMWGGGLKQAANRVKAEGPRTSPKPVSLQPLQAAGKPSRSYFGQGAAAEARRSKDAMSKGNALQALMDAQMKPIEPGKIGGIGGGDFGGPGGGNGNLDRKFAFNGKEPWWWDMMKKRSQMEWEKKFNYKWGWIDWATGLAQKLLDGVLSCLITGTDDWSMGKIGGSVAGAGAEAKCGDLDEKAWNDCQKCLTYGKFGKYSCKNYLADLDPNSSMVKKGWQGSNSSKSDLNFFQARWDCLTNGAFDARKSRKATEGKVGAEDSNCTDFYAQGYYKSSVTGDYQLFHYIVGVEEGNWDAYVRENAEEKRKQYLSIGYVNEGGHFSVDSTEMKQVINERKFVPLFIESVAVKSKKVETQEWDGKVSYNGYFNKGNKKHQCGTFKDVPYDDALKICKAKKPRLTCRASCLASINEQAKGRQKAVAVASAEGLSYNDFLAMLRDGGIMRDSEQSFYMSAKGGKEGKDWSTGARCAYPLAFVSCHHNAQEAGVSFGETDATGAPAAFLTLPNVGRDLYDKIVKRFTVTYKVGDRLAPQDKGYSTQAYFVQQVKPLEGYVGRSEQGSNYTVNADKKYNVVASGKGLEAINAAAGGKDANKSATVTWEVRQCWDDEVPWRYANPIENGSCGRGMVSSAGGVDGSKLPGQIVSTATCVYGDDSATSPGFSDECTSPTQSAKCCTELKGPNFYLNEAGECVEKTTENCKDMNDSAECCAKLGPNGYVWDDVNKCHDPNFASPQPQVSQSLRLSPYFAWVPKTMTDRQPVKAEEDVTVNSFGANKMITPKRDNVQACAWPAGGTVMNSVAAKNFVASIVDKYNAKLAVGAPKLVASEGNPKTGEFVDAMNIAQQLGVTSVPKRAVCELGRQMVAISRDKDVGNENASDGLPFHNELGAFYMYMHDAAALYPAKTYRSLDNCDKRFLGEPVGECTIVKPVAARYKYPNYMLRFKNKGGNWQSSLPTYKKSLPSMLQGGNYPLAALVDGISFPAYSQCVNKHGRNAEYVCGEESKQYKLVFGKFVEPGTSGESCDFLSGDMSLEAALRYAREACANGLDYKPYGVGSDKPAPSILDHVNGHVTGSNNSGYSQDY